MLPIEQVSRKMSNGQVKALQLLLGGHSIAATAKGAGIHVQTLRRWTREDEAFGEELHRRQAELVDSSARATTAAVGKAVRLLVTVLEDKSESAQTRVRAAGVLLAHAGKFREAEKFDRIIDEMEKRISELEGQTAPQTFADA